MADPQDPTTVPSRRPWSRDLVLALGLALAVACGSLHKATAAYEDARYDEALDEYDRVLKKDPKNLEAKIGYRRTAPLAAAQHLAKAEAARKLGDTETETKEVATAAVLDPSNAVAQDWLNRLEAAEERARAEEEAVNSLDASRARGEARQGLPINPRSLDGLDLNFTRKTSLKEILQQLSRNSGVNILLHSSVASQDLGVTADLRGLTFQQVLDALMLQCDLFYRVLEPNSIMVFKRTPQNLLEHENKLIQTFYLSNAEVDNVRQMFSALMPQMRVFPDKRLNALTVLAKSSDLSIARRIVKQLDKAKAEVMIYLELLEVSETTAVNLGLLPVATATATQGAYGLGVTTNSGTGGQNQQAGTLAIKRQALNYIFPSIKLDLAKRSGQTKLLANPNVRVVSGETGEVKIGDKVSATQSSLGPPNLPANAGGSAAAAAAAIGGNLVTQTSYSYEEVGVNIKVKPRVHFNGDITIELDSNIQGIAAGGENGRPNISQRLIKTTARLRNGETAIFGGMIKEDQRKALQGLWGLSSVPVVRDLLGHRDDNDVRTNVILSIRAVLVRKADLTDEDFGPFDPDLAPNADKPFVPKPAKLPARPGEAPARPAPAPEAEAEAEPEPVVSDAVVVPDADEDPEAPAAPAN